MHVALPVGLIFILKSFKTPISLAYIFYVPNGMFSLNFIFTFAYSNIYRKAHLRVVSLRNIHSYICVRPYTSKHVTRRESGFGGLEVACWPLEPKFAGSQPAEAVGFLGRKILSTPSFGGEVKPSVPCRSFTVCKRALHVTCKSEFRQNYRTFLSHSSTFRRWVSRMVTCVETPGGKSWNV